MNPVRDGDVIALAGVETRKQNTGAERLRDFLLGAVFLRLSPTILAKPDEIKRGKGALINDDGRGTVALLGSLTSEQRHWVTERLRGVMPGARSVDVENYDKHRGYIELKERMVSRGGKTTHPIPAWLLSEGTRRLVTIFSLLAVRPRPTLLAIEEIENGLDPWTLNEVFRELRNAAEDGVQILLTTHSPFLLDHVAPEEVLRVQRKHGNTTFKRVTDFESIVKYKDVVAPGAMYLSGFLEDRDGTVDGD
jgi:predicted ATPase